MKRTCLTTITNSNNCDFLRIKMLILVLIISIPDLSFSQISTPVFNWKVKEISKDNNLQGMSIHDENTAVIAGFGKTFKITTDKGISWNDVGLLNPKYNFIDLSIKDNVGYVVGRRSLLVTNPTGGEENVYVNGVLLKTIDNGVTWTLLDLSVIGEGTNTGLNPNAKGCYSLDPYAVLSISNTNAMIFVHWYDVASGIRKSHSAVFKTIDGGKKWSAITEDLGGAYISAIKMLGSDIYIGGNKILLKVSGENDFVTDIFPAFSSVAGSTAFVYEIRFFNNEIYILTLNGAYNSKDNGKTFSKIAGLSGGNDIYMLDDKVIVSLGKSANSKATIDGGTTWVSCSTGNTVWEIPGIFNDSLYALGSSVIFKMAVSDLKAGNFKWVSTNLGDGSSNLQKMHIYNESKALIFGSAQIAKMTGDKGNTWTDAKLPELLMSGGDYDFRSVSSSGNAGYVTSRKYKLIDFPAGEDYFLSGLIFKTEDTWKTWKVLNNKNVGKDTSTDASKNPTLQGCYGMDNYTIECVDAKTAFMYVGWSDTISVLKTVTKHSRVFKTDDGGDLWSAVTKDFGNAFVNSIKFSGETGYLAGNKILLKTIDGGNTFTDLYPKLTIGTDSNLVVSSITMRSNDEVYFQTSNNNKGTFVTRDGGNTFSKLSGVNGGLDFVVLDNNSFLSVGSSISNKFSNDGGATWKACNLDVAIYAAGEVFNDSLYVLGKSNVYKVAVSDLDIKTFIADVKAPNPLKVLYGTSALELVSDNRNIDRCMVYSISGQLVAITEPRAKICRIEYNSLTPGIYIVVALIEGKKYTQKVIFK